MTTPETTAWPRLQSPARVGDGTFGVGVSAKLVVDAAQRAYERGQQEPNPVAAANLELLQHVASQCSELVGLREQLADLRERKDGAYLERNQVVAALSKCFPAGIAKTAIEGWSEDWHGCVYIDLPTGQVSWHFHDSQAHLFAHLPPYAGVWDGHDTSEKYRRLACLQPRGTNSVLVPATELAKLRAQVEQYSNPTNIVRLALEIAAFRAHDEGRTVGELREAACTLFGAEAVGAAIDKARKA